MFSSTPRLRSFVSLLIVTPIGFTSKFYTGPGAWWFNNYGGGIFYEIFWCFVVILFLPYASAFCLLGSVFSSGNHLFPRMPAIMASSISGIYSFYIYRQYINWEHLYMVGFSSLCYRLLCRLAHDKNNR